MIWLHLKRGLKGVHYRVKVWPECYWLGIDLALILKISTRGCIDQQIMKFLWQIGQSILYTTTFESLESELNWTSYGQVTGGYPDLDS